jgi:hypothetical protein
VPAGNADRLLLNGLRATSNYTSFYLSIVLRDFIHALDQITVTMASMLPNPVAEGSGFAWPHRSLPLLPENK